jgi:phosphoribosylamine-glycine ligase
MADIQRKLDRIFHDLATFDDMGDEAVEVRTIPKHTPPKPKTTPEQSKRLFVIVTQDMSGLGWVKKLQEEGEQVVLATVMKEDEEDPEQFNKVGEGWVKRLEFEKAVKELSSPSTYWVFDSNKLSEESDKLRTKGQKVFGTSKLSAKMEFDRAYAVKVATESGLSNPATEEFNDIQKALAFLDSNPDKPYVFKPDAAEFNRLTYVPFREKGHDANRELYFYLENLEGFKDKFILQERKYGVEVNIESWFYEGEPFLSFVGLENKRKHNHDLGEMAGCAGDVVFPVPTDSTLVQDTVGKMFPFYKKEKYTGFADVNVIIGDTEVFFLEVCNRFGYNAHPTLFLTLAVDGFGSIIADYIDGKLEGMEDRFRSGFGVSTSLYIEHRREGLPVYLNEDMKKRFYPFDGYKSKDGQFLLTGYSEEVGIFTDFDYTIRGAEESIIHKLFYNEAVSYPDMFYRTDLGESDYPNAPLKRYEALRALKHFFNWD